MMNQEIQKLAQSAWDHSPSKSSLIFHSSSLGFIQIQYKKTVAISHASDGCIVHNLKVNKWGNLPFKRTMAL